MQVRHGSPSTCSNAHHDLLLTERGLEPPLAALQLVLDHISEGYVVTDPEGTVVELNSAALRLLGHGGADWVGRPLWQAASDDSRPILSRFLVGLHPPRSKSRRHCRAEASPCAVPVAMFEPRAPAVEGEDESHASPAVTLMLGSTGDSQAAGETEGGARAARFRAFPEWGRDGALLRIRWLVTPVPGSAPAGERESADRLLAGIERGSALIQTRTELVTRAQELAAEGSEIVEQSKREQVADRGIAGVLSGYPEFMEHVTQSAEIAIAVLSVPDYRYVYANPYSLTTLGRTGGTVIGLSVHEVLPAQPGRDMVAMLDRACETGRALRVHEYETVMIPGQPVTFWDIEVLPLWDTPSNTLAHLVVIGHEITAQVRGRREAAHLAARLRATLDALPVGVFITDARGSIIERNNQVNVIMHGTPPLEDGPVAPLSAGLPGAPPGTISDWSLSRALRHGETTRGEEIEVLRLDGTRGVVLNAAAPILAPDGATIGAVVTMQDVTELHEAWEKLRGLTGRLEALRDLDLAVLEAATIEDMAARALPWLRDALGCRLVSLSLFEGDALVAFTVGDVDGEGSDPHFQLCHRASLPLEGRLRDLLRGEAVNVVDVENAAVPPEMAPVLAMLRPAGVRAFTAVPLATADALLGTLIVGLSLPGELDAERMVVAREVAAQFAVAIRQNQLREEVRQHTARLELRVMERTAALRASEARFRAIFEGSAVGIAAIDLSGYIVQINPAAREMIGYDEDELLGLHFSAFTDPETREGEARVLGQFITGELDDLRIEKQFTRKDGRPLWVRLAISLVRGAEGEPSFILGLSEDITGQRETEAALLHAEKLSMTGQLAASLAHEIGNPLQTIIGCLGLAKESLSPLSGAPAPGEALSEVALALRHMDMASGEAHRAAGIVRQLRDLNRPAEPQARAHVDLAALVEKVLALGEPEARHRGVEIAFAAPAPPGPVVTVAADQMHQVFLNLVLNAVEAMDEGGRLDVILEPTDAPPGAAVHFRDTGPGIPKEALPHLFDPFYTTKPAGLGLGLYVTHAIVEKHGGTIEVESVVGEGTEFSVWVPA